MISLAAVKAHLRVDGDDEDELLQEYIDGAIGAFESWCNRTLVAAEDPLPVPLGNAMHLKKNVQQGVFLLVANWYANRESAVVGLVVGDLPLSTMALWKPHRWFNI